MIYYFSGTGNSEFVAKTLAKLTKDQAVAITATVQPVDLTGTVTGFIFPIYAWGIAEPMLEFMKTCKGTPNYCYAVATCGADCGKAMQQKPDNLSFQSKYSVVMPNNYVFGSNVEPEAVCIKKIQEARKELKIIAESINDRKMESKVIEGKFAAIKTALVSKAFNRFARSTKPFYVTESCDGCSLCEKNCPTHTITLVNHKPQWGKQCYQCGACINRCPKQAIQYGKATEKRGRYVCREQ